MIICRGNEAEKSSGEIDSRPAYQSVSVAEYLAKKYDITTEVDTSGQGHFD